MVQLLSINFFLGFLQFLLGFSKVPVFFVSLCINESKVNVFFSETTKFVALISSEACLR